jgi:uncharacterized protein GlcG (DUF336 family)
MPPPPPVIAAVGPLSAMDVDSIVQAAVNSENVDMVVAVTDRAGFVLGVFRTANAPVMAQGNFGVMQNANDVAVALARTAAFFSNDQAPLSSRTVRFISGVHFPPGVNNQPNADLYGIENTNRGCTLVPNNPNIPADVAYNKLVPPSTALGGGPGSGLGILTGKADMFDSDPNAVNPGGVPIFYQSVVIGGVGVVTTAADMDVAEFAAFSGAQATAMGRSTNMQTTFSPLPTPLPNPGAVFIGGIALPFVNTQTRPASVSAGPVSGPPAAYLPGFMFPLASQGQPPEGDLIPPAMGPKGGLSAAEVTQILDQAEATANTARAAIRLPPGEKTRMVIAVADTDGTLIGLRRMVDSTIFSIDVAATKARNMIYFNSSMRTAADMTGVPMGTAVTNRTISFGAQPFFPPGIDDSDLPPFLTPGPFFNLFVHDLANPCSQGFQTPGANQSGIVFFPGSTGIFRGTTMVGGLGVSGDGVDQDDFVTNGGVGTFAAPDNIRADQIFIRGVRLPYMKFPRNPTD